MHTYKKFIFELEGKGLLESINSYRVGHYSKRFKLKLPQTDQQPLAFDERNITDFYEALWEAYGSIREIAEATGLNRMTIWNNLQQK
jgi:DNA invertase Pin-like site-specific DNA recombinase